MEFYIKKFKIHKSRLRAQKKLTENEKIRENIRRVVS